MEQNFSNNNLEDLLTKHFLPPFTDYGEMQTESLKIITNASGNYIYDIDGNKILDAMAGLWCVNVGYGRKELVEAASKQMLELSYYNSFFKTSNIPTALLSEKLVKKTPENLNHVFYTNSGSEANDTIIRMVRHYWNLEGKPDKKIIIGREYGYHGSTIMSASVGGMVDMHNQAAKTQDIHHILPPYSYKYGKNISEEDFGEISSFWLEEKILELGPKNVGAFFAEPIQGAGGVIIPPKNYFEKIQEICKKFDVLFVVDEVITGFGRTGKWFASEKMNLSPDLMTLAKGLTSGYLPMAAVMVGERVSSKIITDGGEFYHGFTYSAHPVCAAVALENLKIIERENLISKVNNETSLYFSEKLKTLINHPIVSEVRSYGLLGCVELKNDTKSIGEVGMLCRNVAIRNGLMIRAVRDGMIMSPSLTFSKLEIDEMLKKLKLSLDQVYDDLN